MPQTINSLAATAHGQATTRATCGLFLLTHLWLPLIAALPLCVWLMNAGGDQRIADLIYHLEGGQWLLKRHWITAGLLHRGGKYAIVIAETCVMVLAIASWCRPRLHLWRWPASYLALSVGLSTSLVSLLKSWTQMDCPWDLIRYGGSRPWFGLFEPRHGIAASGCFPAGHASAGYAWVALYFVAMALRPAWRGPALASGLAAGLVFGIAQQLRGAHFMSHDLCSLSLCWLMALALSPLLLLNTNVEKRV